MTSRRSSYHHKFLIYFSFIHHHLTLQNVLRSDRQKSVYRLKKALKILYNSKFPVSFLLLKYPKYYTLTVCLYPRITDSKNITARKLPLWQRSKQRWPFLKIHALIHPVSGKAKENLARHSKDNLLSFYPSTNLTFQQRHAALNVVFRNFYIPTRW